MLCSRWPTRPCILYLYLEKTVYLLWNRTLFCEWSSGLDLRCHLQNRVDHQDCVNWRFHQNEYVDQSGLDLRCHLQNRVDHRDCVNQRFHQSKYVDRSVKYVDRYVDQFSKYVDHQSFYQRSHRDDLFVVLIK
jgi:hypothetical protein